MKYSCQGEQLHHSVSSQYQQVTKSNYLIHTWHDDLWLNIQMVDFSRTHRATGEIVFLLSKAYLEPKLYFIRDLFCVLHKSSELQLPRRVEIRLGGPASRTVKPFKGDISVNTADAASLSAAVVLHPYLCLPVFFCLFVAPSPLAFLPLSDFAPQPSQPLRTPSPTLNSADEAAGRKRRNKRKS